MSQKNNHEYLDEFDTEFDIIEPKDIDDRCSLFGNYLMTITDEHIEALKRGDVLYHLNEYGIFVVLKNEDKKGIAMNCLERIWMDFYESKVYRFSLYKKAIKKDDKYYYCTDKMIIVLDENIGEYEEVKPSKRIAKTLEEIPEELKKEQHYIGSTKSIVKYARKQGYSIAKRIRRYLYNAYQPAENKEDFTRTFDIRLADQIDRILGNTKISLLGPSDKDFILLKGDIGYALLLPVIGVEHEVGEPTIKVV